MTTTYDELFRSILAMDSYNRGSEIPNTAAASYSPKLSHPSRFAIISGLAGSRATSRFAA